MYAGYFYWQIITLRLTNKSMIGCRAFLSSNSTYYINNKTAQLAALPDNELWRYWCFDRTELLLVYDLYYRDVVLYLTPSRSLCSHQTTEVLTAGEHSWNVTDRSANAINFWINRVYDALYSCLDTNVVSVDSDGVYSSSLWTFIGYCRSPWEHIYLL